MRRATLYRLMERLQGKDWRSIMETFYLSSIPGMRNSIWTGMREYSRRINIRHRLVYQVYEKKKVVKVLRLWTHYE